MNFPRFPNFKKITIYDRKKIRSFLSEFESYSDFNFTSIFVWGHNEAQYSWLHGNLVITMPDYSSGEPIYSLIGINKPSQSVKQLLEFVKKQGINCLNLVPEIIASKLDDDQFEVSEDRDNFDYIYSVKNILNLNGGDYENKRYHIRKLLDKDADSVKVKSFKRPTPKQKDSISNIFQEWSKTQDDQDQAIQNEKQAIDRLIKYSSSLGTEGIILYINKVAVAFELHERLHDSSAIGHFMKSMTSNGGMFALCTYSTMMVLEEYGCNNINIEQDFGIEELRYAKMSYRPVKFLKKYTVSLK